MDPQRFDRLTRTLGTRLSRRTALSTGVGLGSLALAGTEAAAQEATPVAAGEQTETLFVQTFEHGALQPKEGEAGTFVLTLQGDYGRAIAFSDRPERLVASVPTEQFLEGLGFSPTNPPNAALVFEPSPGETDIIVLELLNPQYDAANQMLTYDVRILDAFDTEGGLSFQEEPRQPDPAGEAFGLAQLFIDSCSDLTQCVLLGESMGPIPGEPIGQCWTYSTGCQPNNPPCTGQPLDYYVQLCTNTYDLCESNCIPE
jgi:hypothetical protein